MKNKNDEKGNTVLPGKNVDKSPDKGSADSPASTGVSEKVMRADAQRSNDALLEAAKAVFASSGVEAPVREIARKAGVGVGTLYRHYPERSDLVAAVFRREIDYCAARASEFAAQCDPFEALEKWIQCYADFIATKRGLASALHSGNPAFKSLPDYFDEHLRPAITGLLVAAIKAGSLRDDVEADDILYAVASLCSPARPDRPHQSQRLVGLFIDGLRFGAPKASNEAG